MKNNSNLKIKYASLYLCDAFLSETLTIEALLSSVILLALTFPHKTNKARMNKKESLERLMNKKIPWTKELFFSMKALLCKILMFSWLIKKLIFIWIALSPLISPAYSNKNLTFGYPLWNKCFPLISVSTPINNAPLNVGLLQLLPYSTSS